jgi:hypothetical protein
MTSSDLSPENNKKINILILLILIITILIFGLLTFYNKSMEYRSPFLNNIITGLTYTFIFLIIIASFLYIMYRYNNGEDIINNIDIVIKPLISIIVGILVAMFFISYKNSISSSKSNLIEGIIIIASKTISRPSLLTETPEDIYPPKYETQQPLIPEY